MNRKLVTLLGALLAVSLAAGTALAERTVEERIKALEKKIQTLQVNDTKDNIRWGGDLRVEAHTTTGEIPDYIDGMRMQSLVFGTMFYTDPDYNPSFDPMAPFGPADIDRFIGQNYANFQVFQGQTTFGDVKDWVRFMMANNPNMGAMMQANAQDAYRQGYDTDNDILYTTRLRLNLAADVADDVSFTGRLSMYKPWGASTQTVLFNGQPNTLNTDANWPGVPGDATLRVDRAYFTWNNLFRKPVYLSLGRRPSTEGPPLHYRHDEMRAGTPMGTIIDFQFDGATLGWHLAENSTIRACYGLGYESQYGQGMTSVENALKDAQFFGFNIDAWDTPAMQVQTTLARAFDITDGFDGLVILPTNPVSGQPMPGPIVTRFSPSANLGDFDLASILLSRTDGPIDWFATASWSKSRPVDTTGPFGGLLSDPYDTPESHNGSMYYLGARYNLKNGRTKVGFEWNKGSQYWFNFTPAADDILGAKTATRGTATEAYVTHRFAQKFVAKLSWIGYAYDYTGSGWHVGAPKELGDVPVVQGFPTWDKAGMLTLSFSARF